jgi:Domain of unknown function (DUF5597)/Beta-galactosidase
LGDLTGGFVRFIHIFKTLLLIVIISASLGAQENTHIAKKDGRSALILEGKPYLMLGAQINNSSSWPTSLPKVWPALEAMHVNTVEAPVYWEQLEPEPGKFDFSTVDLLVNGAREHNVHLVILWFGTWKNGQAHYVPEWVKTDLTKYPRQISAYGKVLDVMSPNSANNLEADKRAFAAMMRHIKGIDATQHTVLMIQVENESGSIGAVRDFSAAAQKEFSGKVPASLTSELHTANGTWSEVFGADADERFAAYSISHYINEIAAAGKAEYGIPMYCNVWITYPVHALENRDHPSPGQEYPSGGPQQVSIAVWKATAKSIDILAPDFYSDDLVFYRDVITAYGRSDNPLFIPETGLAKNFGRYFFYALGKGAIGFSPFGVDFTGWTPNDDKVPSWLSDNFALIYPMSGEIARLNFDGKLQTAIEDKGATRQKLHFGNVDAVVSFGGRHRDGELPTGTEEGQGRALVAQLGPLEFLVTGFDSSVSFQLAAPADGKAPPQQLEILRADEGVYRDGVWQNTRIWNGDQTDRGLNFKSHNTEVIRTRLHAIPLNATHND